MHVGFASCVLILMMVVRVMVAMFLMRIVIIIMVGMCIMLCVIVMIIMRLGVRNRGGVFYRLNRGRRCCLCGFWLIGLLRAARDAKRQPHACKTQKGPPAV